ncbi:hypothetical protein DFJ74DRAFT_17618 [Hyaloraphidium curvatum]|nr:hypothetical protein DFJ74DRAFT_17618 [Hyaloraphidium curvatum]
MTADVAGGPPSPEAGLFRRLLELPADVIEASLAFLGDEDTPVESEAAVLARDSLPRGSYSASFAASIFSDAGSLGDDLDRLLRQWAICFEHDWKLKSERAGLASLLKALTSKPRDAVAWEPEAARAQTPGTTGKAARSRPKGEGSRGSVVQKGAKKAPNDAGMTLAVLDATLDKLHGHVLRLTLAINDALARLAKLRADCTFLRSFHRAIINETMRQTPHGTMDDRLSRRLTICNLLDSLAERCSKVLSIAPSPLESFDSAPWDAIAPLATAFDSATRTPDRRARPSTSFADAQARANERGLSRSVPSSQVRSSQTDLSMVASSLAAKALESPSIAKLLDGGVALHGASDHDLVDDSETDEEFDRKPRRPRRQQETPLAAEHPREVAPTPTRAAEPRLPDPPSSQDIANASNGSTGSSLSPSVLAVPASGKVRASGAPAPQQVPVDEEAEEPQLHPASRRTTQQLRDALAALLDGESDNGAFLAESSQEVNQHATDWSPEASAPELPAARRAKRALSDSPDTDSGSVREAKRHRTEDRQPLAARSQNSQQSSGDANPPSMFSRLLGWVGMGRSSGSDHSGSQKRDAGDSAETDEFHSV